MTRQELQSEYDRLRHQIETIRASIGKSPDELVSLGCQSVCISICGSLEQSVKGILVEYTKRKSQNQIHRPIERLCEGYQNPKSTRILELVSLFDKDFGTALKQSWELENEVEKDHLNNLVDARNTIAHRRKQHVNVTTGRLNEYFKAYKGLLDRVYQHFLG